MSATGSRSTSLEEVVIGRPITIDISSTSLREVVTESPAGTELLTVMTETPGSDEFQKRILRVLTSKDTDAHQLRELIESPNYIREENFLNSSHLVELYHSIVNREENYISVFDSIRTALCDKNDPNKLKNNKDKAIQLVRDYLDKNMIPDFNLGLGKPSQKTNIQIQDRGIFIMAVIFDLKEIAEIFMLKNQSPIAAALVGSAMLKGLSQKAEMENEYSLEKKYKERSIEYQKLAVEAMYKCYKDDSTNAIHLVIRKLDTWNGGTLLSIADAVKAMEFMGTEACQSRLTQIWEGYFYFSSTKQWTYVLGILFPLIVLKERNKHIAHKQYDEQDGSRKRKTLEKREVDEWYPTAKNSFCRGFQDDRWGCLTPLIFFYPTPRVKLYTHTLAYVIYLGLLSYFICVCLSPTEERPIGPLAYIVWIWAASMLLDEIREMVGHRPQYAKANLTHYIGSNGWNMIDFGTQLCMIVSVILHNTLPAKYFSWARGSYAITLCLSFLRIINISYASSKLGPLVITMREMTKDLMRFMFIIAVFVVGYGVASRSLRYPNQVLTGSAFVNILYEPYWNIFGELFENDGRILVANANISCTSNITLHWADPERHPRCPEDPWLAVVLFGMFMLITSVLLLNLLIAIFSNTYQGITQKSRKIWKFYRHQLVMEYYEKSTLAPPFILFSHFFRMIKFVISSCRKGKKNTPFYRDLESIACSKLNGELTTFEQSKMKEVLEEKAGEKTVDDKLDDLKTNFKMMVTEETVHNMIENVSAEVTLNRDKLDKIEQQLDKLLRAVTANTQ